jgi:hypothetical protein
MIAPRMTLSLNSRESFIASVFVGALALASELLSLGDAVGGRLARSAHARLALTMPRDGAIVFRDLVGKL